jgi:hypothetical protein
MTKGMQNHVLFLKRRKLWMKKRMNMTMAAMMPAAMVGVYGQSTYSGLSLGDSVDDMVDGETLNGGQGSCSIPSGERWLCDGGGKRSRHRELLYV